MIHEVPSNPNHSMILSIPQVKSQELKSLYINCILTQANASRQDSDTFKNLRVSL